jgi:hypothetical protein
MAHSDLNSHKVFTIVSFVLSVYGTLRYLVGRSPADKHNGFHVNDTPFTANILVTFIYWVVLFLMQLLFVSQVFVPAANNDGDARLDYSRKVGWHFTLFNVGHFVWSMLFARKHFVWSEIVLILNFFNILSLYATHKTYSIKPLKVWALIHLPTAALPFSWLLLAIFWNGAVMFHVHKFVGRVVSNVLIWDFLLAPGLLLFAYNDWGVGFSSAVLMFALGLGQFFTKVFALQWIFAFVIAGVLFVLSVIAAITGSLGTSRAIVDEEAPLLT